MSDKWTHSQYKDIVLNRSESDLNDKLSDVMFVLSMEKVKDYVNNAPLFLSSTNDLIQ